MIPGFSRRVLSPAFLVAVNSCWFPLHQPALGSNIPVLNSCTWPYDVFSCNNTCLIFECMHLHMCHNPHQDHGGCQVGQALSFFPVITRVFFHCTGQGGPTWKVRRCQQSVRSKLYSGLSCGARAAFKLCPAGFQHIHRRAQGGAQHKPTDIHQPTLLATAANWISCN